MISTPLLAVGALLPGLVMAGFVALAVPLLIHMLLRRRTRVFKWSAMQLLEQAVRRQRRLRVLRVIVFTARTLMLCVAACALGGVHFGDATDTDVPNWDVIVVDDTIAACVQDEHGHRAVDRHVQTAADLLAMQAHPPVVLSLTGRVLPDDGTQLADTAVGADWTGLAERLQAISVSRDVESVLLVSQLREGTLAGGDALPADTVIHVHEEEIAHSMVDAVHILDVIPPRPVQLPGDPLARSGMHVDMHRDGRLPSESTQVHLRTHDGVVIEEVDVHWAQGESSRTVVLQRPQADKAGTHVFHVHADTRSPSGSRWMVEHIHTDATVFLLTDDPADTFDAGLDAAWISAGIEASSSDLQVEQLDPMQLHLDMLGSEMPIVVASPHALSTDTWRELVALDSGASIVILPPSGGDERWLNTLQSVWTETLVAFPTGSTPFVDIDSQTVSVASSSDMFQAVRQDLPKVLAATAIERWVDLRPLVEHGGQPVISIGEHPLVVSMLDGRLLVTAVAWHPTWSDIPLRAAGPTLLQELIRAHSGQRQDVELVASHQHPVVGHHDGLLIQPDVEAAKQAPISEDTLVHLTESGALKIVNDLHLPHQGTDSRWFILALVILILVELVLAREIDRPATQRRPAA